MSTEQHHIVVSGLRVDIVRKDIKNLHLGIYPPDGRVRVAVPLQVDDNAVRLAVIGKLAWIKRQQAKFTGQTRQSKREMVGGETHYCFGQRCRLRVVEYDGPTRIERRGKTIIALYTRHNTTREHRERALNEWYRQQLKALIPPILDKWQSVLDVEVADWVVKKMKTRWGTCSPETGRICINLELAKKPEYCLEYIIVHELVHLIERNHGDRFTTLMDKHLPKWRFLRQELNAAPLVHETWLY